MAQLTSTVKMGFEGIIYYGAAGSTAATQLTEVADLAYNVDVTKSSTKVRGNGESVPKNTVRATAIIASVEWTMLHNTGDTALTALKAAARAGTPVAIKTLDKDSSGKGIDADCYLTVQNGMPLEGEQTFVFTAEPARDQGREPSLNA